MTPVAPLRFLLLAASTLLVTGILPGQEKEEGKEEPAKEKGEKKKKKKKAAEKKAVTHDLEAWGALKEVKGTPFFTLAYTKIAGKKATKGNVFVKPADDAIFYQDKMIPFTDLKEGDQVWILCRPVEHDVPATQGGGTGGTDRQLQNVVALAMGEGLKVNQAYTDPRDPKLKWCETKVSKGAPSLQATYEETDYKVVMGKQTPILLRERVDTKPLKSGLMIEVAADKSTERPETKSAADEKKDSFAAKKVVLLDPRLRGTVYPVLIE